MNFLDFLYEGQLYGEIAIGVKDLPRAVAWYCGMFDLVEDAASSVEVTVGYRGGKSRAVIPLVTLVQIPAGRTEAVADRHPILFSRSLTKTRQDLISKGISAGAIERDSGGNHFFQFQDLDGNRIEVCLEPGKKLTSESS